VHLADTRASLEALHRPGRIVVCGLGARGCAVRSDNGYREHRAVDLPQPVVDCNGAGDALAAGLLAAHVIEGLELDDGVHQGQLAARWCCAHRGSDNLITRSELDTLTNTTT
jgi:sugar/nucleoside kinase (ribokinase family)